jgi:hypothetical protein
VSADGPRETLAARTERRENAMGKVAKVKDNVKGVLNQRVRVGFFTVPIWALGAFFVVRGLRNRRKSPAYSS